VRATADLGDAQAANRLSADRRGKELGPQLGAAMLGEGRRAHVGLHADRHRNRATVHVGQRFGEDRGEAVVQAHTAVLDGLVQAEQAELAHLPEDLMGGEELGPLPFVHMGIDFLGDPALDGAAGLVVLVGQLHDGSGVGTSQGRATENCIGWGVLASASRQTASTVDSTARVSRGSMTPSSSRRALVVNTLIWPLKRSTICSRKASSLAVSTLPFLRSIAAAVTLTMVPAACSPPMTAVTAFGQLKQNRGWN